MQCDKTSLEGSIYYVYHVLIALYSLNKVVGPQKNSQFLKSKMADRSEMARNAIQSEFRTSKMTEGSHFVKNFQKNKIAYRSEMARNASDLKNVRTDCWLTTTWYQLYIYIYTYRQLCWERGNIHCVRPLGRMHTILVFL